VIGNLPALERHDSNGGLPGVCRTVPGYCTLTYPFLRAKLRYYRKRLDTSATVHPFAIYTVDPGVIERHVPYRVFHKFPKAGPVRAGEWDSSAGPLGSHGNYALLRRDRRRCPALGVGDGVRLRARRRRLRDAAAGRRNDPVLRRPVRTGRDGVLRRAQRPVFRSRPRPGRWNGPVLRRPARRSSTRSSICSRRRSRTGRPATASTGCC